MKITHLTSVHPRYDTRIFYKHCIYGVKSGFEVTLLVNDTFEAETIENVRILSTNKKFKSKSSRIFDSILKFPIKAISVHSDVYVIHDPELIPCGIVLKMLRNKIIFDIHEDYYLVLLNHKRIFSKFIGYLYKFLSNRFVKNIDGIFVVNYNLYSQYVNISKRILLVPNYPIINKNHVVKTIKPDDSIIRLVFAGGITEDWNIEMIANIIQNYEDFELHIIGKDNEYLKSLKLDNKKNVFYHGHHKHDEISKILNQMDIGLAVSSSIQLQGKGSIGNTKVFEYLANGLPVIVNKNDVWQNVIGTNNLGFILDKVNETSVSQLLNNLDPSKAKLSKMGKAGFELVKSEYNWEKTNNFLNIFYTDLTND